MGTCSHFHTESAPPTVPPSPSDAGRDVSTAGDREGRAAGIRLEMSLPGIPNTQLLLLGAQPFRRGLLWKWGVDSVPLKGKRGWTQDTASHMLRKTLQILRGKDK